MRILAVDDDPLALRLVEATLRSASYADVTLAHSAVEAMAQIAAAREPFDCFLLDVQMPGADGIELCGQVRRLEPYRHAPILMITAVTDRDAVERALDAGAVDYVNKPFDPLELVVRIGVAERLCRQDADVRRRQRQLDVLRSRSGLTDRPNLDEAFSVARSSTLVSALEMENHLLRLSRLRAWRSSSYAIRIEFIEHLHASLSGEDFYDLVADVGDLVARALKPWHHVLSHVGAGTFIAVVHDPFEVEALREAVWAQAVHLAPDHRARGLPLRVDPSLPIAALASGFLHQTALTHH